MKIVYISDSAIPSSSPNSVHVMKMCQAFAVAGHQVTLIGKNTTACFQNVTDKHAFYAVQKNFDLTIQPRKPFKGSGAWYNLSMAWRVLGLKADLVYTRSITAAFFRLLYNLPVVFEVHEPFEGKGTRLRRMFAFIVRHRKLQKLVVISAALKRYYQDNFGLPASAIHVAHDGADPFPAGAPALQDAGFSVGYVGSLYPGKGMEILVPLAQASKDVHFHVVGGNKQQIQAIHDRVGALPNLTFHGFQTQQALPGFIRSFDVLIAPYTDQVIVSEKKGANNLALWMSPLKLFEYMSAGKPIITSSLAVIQEVVQHEETALLCDPASLPAWQAAIARLQQDVGLRQKLGAQALREFTRHYTWEQRAVEILNAIPKA
jgi:glycosyltransferase involved in cell wall biosynthesis